MKKFSFVPLPETGRLSEDSARRYFSILGFAVLAMNLTVTAAQYAIYYLSYFFLPAFFESVFFSSVLSLVSLYVCGLPVLLLILHRLPRVRPAREKRGAGFFWCGLCVCFAFVMVGNSVSQFLMQVIEPLLGREVANPVESMTEGAPFLVNLLFLVILAPLLEELVFRKILCDRLLPLGEGYAIFLSASIFALFHGNFYQLFYAFLVGACLGYIYVKSGKLAYSVGFHMAVNFFFGLLPLLVMQQIDLEQMTVLMEELLSGSSEALQGLVTFTEQNLLPMLAYVLLSEIQMAGYVAGTVILIILMIRRKITFEGGLLAPPAHARISPIFMNFGVALAIAAFVFQLLLSIMPAGTAL